VLLADEYFFAARDVGTGKLRLHARAAGIGLAGALLGELVLSQAADIKTDTLIVGRQTPEDDLGYRIYLQLAADQHHRSVRTWLAFLAQGAHDRVAQRLTQKGHVEAVKSRRLFGTTVRYLPTDAQEAIWPADRLFSHVNRGKQLDFSDAMLAGLIMVTGLTKHVWVDGDASTMRQITTELASLPMSLRELLSHTEAAVGDITLSPHR
jgi:hypothetical protein